MTAELESFLNEKAKRQFGEERASEIQDSLTRLAAELLELRSFPLTIHDEA